MGLETDFVQSSSSATLLPHSGIRPGKLGSCCRPHPTRHGLRGYRPGLLELTAPHQCPKCWTQSCRISCVPCWIFISFWPCSSFLNTVLLVGWEVCPVLLDICNIFYSRGLTIKTVLLVLKTTLHLDFWTVLGLLRLSGLLEGDQMHFSLWGGLSLWDREIEYHCLSAQHPHRLTWCIWGL